MNGQEAKQSQKLASPTAAAAKKGGRWRPVLLLAVLVTILVLAKVFNVGEKLGALRDWITTLGPLVFVLIYLVAVVAALPGSALTIAAGALFGSVLGIILVSISATIGAGLAFLIGRYFAREAVVRWLSKNEKFQRLDQLTEEHGAVIVALTRLVPIFPFNLLNYGFGLTRVPFWTYVFWSWLCMLPGTALYVVGADAFTKGLAQGKVPWGLIGALTGVVVILTFLVRAARKKLQLKEMKTEASSPDAGEPYREPEVSPLDQYNEALLTNVHPAAWENPEPAPRYNLVVIGAGTAGLVTAAGAAGLGAKVALVERHLMGGDCLNYGCVPSKAIIRSSRIFADLRDAGQYGVKAIRGAEVDFPAVMERMRRLRAGISHHEILVGAARAPNVEGLNLEAAGVKYEGGKGRGVIVNDKLQTTNANIYAAGDICLPYQFTHLADAAARIVIQNALFFGRKKLSALTIPWCTYTDPEVAHVGLSESEAQKKGLAIQTFMKPLSEVDRAIVDGEVALLWGENEKSDAATRR